MYSSGTSMQVMRASVPVGVLKTCPQFCTQSVSKQRPLKLQKEVGHKGGLSNTVLIAAVPPT